MKNVLTQDQVFRILQQARPGADKGEPAITELCKSHEKLRAELDAVRRLVGEAFKPLDRARERLGGEE